jgi:hypothetical protein
MRRYEFCPQRLARSKDALPNASRYTKTTTAFFKPRHAVAFPLLHLDPPEVPPLEGPRTFRHAISTLSTVQLPRRSRAHPRPFSVLRLAAKSSSPSLQPAQAPTCRSLGPARTSPATAHADPAARGQALRCCPYKKRSASPRPPGGARAELRGPCRRLSWTLRPCLPVSRFARHEAQMYRLFRSVHAASAHS